MKAYPTLIALIALLFFATFTQALVLTPTFGNAEQNSQAVFQFAITGNETNVSATMLELIGADNTHISINPSINIPRTLNTTTTGNISFFIGFITPQTYNSTLHIVSDQVNTTKDFILNVQKAPHITITQQTEGVVYQHKITGQILNETPMTFVITNTGTEVIPSVHIQTTPFTFGANQVQQISLSSNDFTLLPGQNRTITLQGGFTSSALGTYTSQVTVSYGAQKQTIAAVTRVHAATIPTLVSNNELPESKRNATIQQNITITNNDTKEFTGVQLVLPSTITITQAIPNTLAAGQSINITINATIPFKQNSGKEILGTIILKADQGTSDIPVYSNAISMLNIDNVRLYVDDFVGSTVTTNRGTFKQEPNPGATFKITVQLQNDYADTDAENINLENIGITAEFIGIAESEDDLTGNEKTSIDLNPKEKAEVELEWDEDPIIDWDAQEGTHELHIIVQGEDENGAIHASTITALATVHRDVGTVLRIIDYSSSSLDVTCGEGFTIEAYGRNIGQRKNENARMILSNKGLDIYEDKKFKIGRYSAEECDAIANPTEGCREFNFKKTFYVPINAESKVYPLTLKTYYDNSESSDEKTINIKVSCTVPTVDTPVEDTTQTTTSQPPTNQSTTTIPPKTTTTTPETPKGPLIITHEVLPPSASTHYISYKTPLSNSPLYNPVLIALIITVVGGIMTAGTVLRK